MEPDFRICLSIITPAGMTLNRLVSQIQPDGLRRSLARTFEEKLMSYHGKFSGNPRTEWLIDATGADRNMALLEDFWYVDPDGKKWRAPKGSVVNGASIPRPLWSSVGSPYTDDYRRASIVHDVACDDSAIRRKDADVMFYFACLAGGCSCRQAKLLYAGVRIGAWASGSLAQESFAKERLLFRVPFKPNSDEQFVQSKFQELSSDLLAIPDDASIEELDVVIERHLKF